MDIRTALKKGTLLQFLNASGGSMQYTIERELGRGASSIVYEASYRTNAGDLKKVRIKELYPYKLAIRREENGDLLPSPEALTAFQTQQHKMWSDFQKGNALFSSMPNDLVNTLDIYPAHQTLYLVSSFSPEQTLGTFQPDTLKNCLTLIRQTASILERIHDAGYLYLDLKPENVLVGDGQCTRVLLFDFDSLYPIPSGTLPPENTGIRLSYTRGYAALELQCGQQKRLGFHTDVYGLAALLFDLLFHRTPLAPDGEADTSFDFSQMVYPCDSCSDQLLLKLTDFFHHTLASFYLDRYAGMRPVIEKLTEMEELADPNRMWIHSTVLEPVSCFGRASEKKQLAAWLSDPSRKSCLLSGISGCGKSTLVRSFLAEQRSAVDVLLYLDDPGSVSDALANDHQFLIQTVSKDPSESQSDYVERKCRILKEQAARLKILVALEVSDFEENAALKLLLQSGCRVLLISRKAPETEGTFRMRLGPLDPEAVEEMAAFFLGRSLVSGEKEVLQRLSERLSGHALLIRQMLRQLQDGQTTLEELDRKCGQIPEKDRMSSDLSREQMVRNLLDPASLSGEQQLFFKILALLGPCGLPVSEIKGARMRACFQSCSALMEEGWIFRRGKEYVLHPLFTDLFLQEAWSLAEQEIIGRLLEELFPAEAPDFSEETLPDDGTVSRMICWNKALGRAPIFAQSTIRQRLTESLLRALPEVEEDLILENGRLYLRLWKEASPMVILRILRKMLFVLEAKGEYIETRKLLHRGEECAGASGDPSVRALYYDLCSYFYDAFLNGAYQTEKIEEDEILSCARKSLEQEIRYARKAGNRNLLAQSELAKATFLMRGNTIPLRKIHRLLKEAGRIVVQEQSGDPELYFTWCMVNAWYDVMVLNAADRMEEELNKARFVLMQSHPTDLDVIDRLVIPHANLLFECGDAEEALTVICQGIGLCEKYPGIRPYARKREALFAIAREICDRSGMENERKALDHRFS